MDQRPVIVDLHRLERDLDEVRPARAPQPIDYAPPHIREVLPAYVRHAHGVSQIGAASAAAVARMHEEAAKAIEAMGEEQRRLAERCEAVMKSAYLAMENTKAVAEQYRTEGKEAFALIESQALLTEEVTKICSEMRKRIEDGEGVA